MFRSLGNFVFSLIPVEFQVWAIVSGIVDGLFLRFVSVKMNVPCTVESTKEVKPLLLHAD